MLKNYLTILPTLAMIAAMTGGATTLTDRAARHVPVRPATHPATAVRSPASGVQKVPLPG